MTKKKMGKMMTKKMKKKKTLFKKFKKMMTNRLFGVFVPHGGAGVNASDVISRIDFFRKRIATDGAPGIGIAARLLVFVVTVFLAQLRLARRNKQ